MNDTNELGWADLLKLADEIKADNGPGTAAWHAQGSETEQINARVMTALRSHGGTLPGELGSIPCLILTTVGARTGERRAVPLFCLTVDSRLVIIGSMGGAERNPPWFYNLRKTSEVVVEKDGETFDARAIILADKERDYFFRKFSQAYPIFAEYQAGISRVIPIVELRRLEIGAG